MTQESHQPMIRLSVHESSDPSLISPNAAEETSGELNDLNDSVHDDENVDVPIPKPLDPATDENSVLSQATIANLGAG